MAATMTKTQQVRQCKTRIGPLDLLSPVEAEELLPEIRTGEACSCDPATHAAEFVAWFKKHRGLILRRGIADRMWLERRLLALVADLNADGSCDMPTSLRELADEYERSV
jgi:hypothetical protein